MLQSTFLHIALEELFINKGEVNLPVKKSYMSQESWVQHDSIRNNILFGEKFKLDKYEKVLWACCLDKDLQNWMYGDKTLVGEKGLMLSGGQKARVSLARAIYREADIYLLDDPLSALDKTVAKQIMDRCILGYLKDKITILATHQVHFLRSADLILRLEDGHIIEVSKSSVSSLETDNKENSNLKIEEEENFILDEDMKEGALGWTTYKDYFKSGSLLILGIYLIMFAISFGMKMWFDTIVSDFLSKELDLTIIWGLLSIFGIMIITELSRQMLFNINTAKCSINLHNEMFRKVMSVAPRFFDINPKGRILNRFSRDLGFIDSTLSSQLEFLILYPGGILVTFSMAIYNVFYLIFPFGIVLIGLLLTVKWISKKSSELKRYEAISRSPIYDLIDDALDGLLTIRTFGKQNNFMEKFYKKSDIHSQTTYATYGFLFFGIHSYYVWTATLQLITNIVCVSFSKTLDPSLTSVILSYVNTLIFPLMYAFRVYCDFDNQV